MLFLGPGGSGEATPATVAAIPALPTVDLMKATGPIFDAFSYHFYGAVSSRCAAYGADANTTLDAALSEQWLGKTGIVEEFYANLRDRFEPGKPLWLTETAQAACGGDRWASTYLDSFRYLNQLGTLAKRGVQVTMHNTLAASDYALLDTKTYTPRPNYWSAYIWRKLMGTTVLDPGSLTRSNVASLCALPAQSPRRRRTAGAQYQQDLMRNQYKFPSPRSATISRRVN